MQQPGLKTQMSEEHSPRIVVEIVSHADVRRLEERDDELRKLIDQQNRRIEGLHRTIFDLIDAIGKRR